MALTSIGSILSILQTAKAQISPCYSQADQSLCCSLWGINAISDEMVDTACVIVYILGVLQQNISCGVILSNCSSVQTREGLRLSMDALLFKEWSKTSRSKPVSVAHHAGIALRFDWPKISKVGFLGRSLI